MAMGVENDDKMSKVSICAIFRERLGAIMLERGATQADLARAVGCHRQVISNYLRGKNEPSGYALAIIAVYLDVSLDYLLGIGASPRIGSNPRLEPYPLDIEIREAFARLSDLMEQATPSRKRPHRAGRKPQSQRKSAAQ